MTRVELDAYFTPPELAQAIVERIEADGYWRGGNVLEPSAGKGAFANAALYLQPHSVTCFDIDPERCRELSAEAIFRVRRCDFLQELIGDTYELVIGNPPFLGAEEHVRRALLMRAPFGCVAFLLRLAFLETVERQPFWAEHPASHVYVLTRRPSFTGTGTDNCAYGVFVWANWHRGPTLMSHLDWKPAKRAKVAA